MYQTSLMQKKIIGDPVEVNMKSSALINITVLASSYLNLLIKKGRKRK